MNEYFEDLKKLFVETFSEVKGGIDASCRSNDKQYSEEKRNEDLDALHTVQEKILIQSFEKPQNDFFANLNRGEEGAFMKYLLVFDKVVRDQLSRGVQSLQTFAYEVSSFVFLDCL